MEGLKLWWHKKTNWEYWSANVVYAPTFFLWINYAITLRNRKFYKYSNPSIHNGGLYDVSKMAIYELLPKNTYPITVFVSNKEKTDITSLIQEHNLSFPLIVKPDRGLRGIMVQKAYTIKEIEEYARALNQDFLIQEIVNYENEMGLFYVRMPNESKGIISGITLKKFLTIKGDGLNTLEFFIRQNPRFLFQLEKLRKSHDLSTILKKDEELCLVPFGNHNRGTEFIDGSHLISDKLTATFDDILSKIDGFYYGRLDLRYNSFEELENGQKFSIIELNGAMSEPTHIYDVKNSFWDGQREIYRHQKMFYTIAKLNLESKSK